MGGMSVGVPSVTWMVLGEWCAGDLFGRASCVGGVWQGRKGEKCQRRPWTKALHLAANVGISGYRNMILYLCSDLMAGNRRYTCSRRAIIIAIEKSTASHSNVNVATGGVARHQKSQAKPRGAPKDSEPFMDMYWYCLRPGSS